MREIDLVIIGGGAAGMSGALGALNNGTQSILIIEKESDVGGILNQCIHNGFGLHTFKEELSGPSYAEKYYNQLDLNKIEIKYESQVISISEDKILLISSKDGYEEIKAKAILLASGSKERTGAVISLKGDRPIGVYTAGTAQKYLNIDGILVGKKVFILGSGDIGLIMARRMTLEGAKVLGVAELMPYSNGLARNIKQCLEDFDIPLHLSHTVTRVIGYPRLKAIELAKVDENRQVIEDTKQIIECDCLLLSVGLIPDDSLIEDLNVKMAKNVIVDNNYMSSIPGIFLAGNALHIHDLVDFVSSEGYEAGVACAHYIKDNKVAEIKHHSIVGDGIGYIIPQVFDDSDVTFSFRVNRIFKKCKIHIVGDGIDKTINKLSLVPSEMERIKLTKEELSNIKGDLKIEVLS